MLTHWDVRSDAWRVAGLTVVALVALSACAPRRVAPTLPPPRPVPPEVVAPAEAGPPRLEAPPGATVFEVDPDHSVVTLRVHRAGPMARLGHNHVIRSGKESGQAWTSDTLERSGFDVRVTVADLVVDEPAARQEAGPDFAAVVPEDSREGTRRNLLRPEVLDAEHYPVIAVQAASMSGAWESPIAQADVWLKGHARRIEVPLELRREAGTLVARGTFRILQSDFGIVPFSVGGGAIQVADEVAIDFEIRAVERWAVVARTWPGRQCRTVLILACLASPEAAVRDVRLFAR